MASNRKKPRRKKKSVSSGSKSRNFSGSSERYFINQIHNSMAGSLCDFPSNPTGSVELETVAETECNGLCNQDGGEGADLPNDDDIEKSFRVNQDGSMTVEMKVRLTIKEEETVQWTTTLKRAGTANQVEPHGLAESELEDLSLQPQDNIDGNNSKDDIIDVTACDGGNEEDDAKNKTVMARPRRIATPGPRKGQKQVSVESVTKMTADEIQQNTVGSYSYQEETKKGNVMEYCEVRQCSSRPASVLNGKGKMLQVEDGEEEITEKVLHIYEQQTCHDSYLANNMLHGRATTKEQQHRAHFSTGSDLETELGRPSTGSGSISASSKPKVKMPKSRQSTASEKRHKESNADVPKKHKKAKKGLTSTASLRKIYGYKPKTVKRLVRKKRQGTEKDVQTTNTELPVNTVESNIQNPKELSTGKRQSVNTQEKGTLKSMHEEKTFDKGIQNMSESIPLPAIRSSSNEYVEHWLENAQPSPTVNMEGKSLNVETNLQMKAVSSESQLENTQIVAKTSNIHEITPSVGLSLVKETPLSRNASMKKTKLVSNTSLANIMAERKAAAEQSALTSDPPLKNTMSTPVEIALENIPPSIGLSSEKTASSPSYYVSSSASSVTSEHRPVIDLSSDEVTSPTGQTFKETSIKVSDDIAQTDPALSRKHSVKKTRLVSNHSLEKMLSDRKATSEKYEQSGDPAPVETPVPSSPTSVKPPQPKKRSMKATALHNNAALNTTTLPTSPGTEKTSAPNSLSTERIPAPRKNLLPKRLSPYSQSLEVVSPRTTRKVLEKEFPTTNQSLDSLADPMAKNIQTPTPPSPSPLNPEHTSNNEEELTKTNLGDRKEASTIAEAPPQSPDVHPVMKLEKLCHLLQSIRHITQNKRTFSLENSNSFDDFSSHVATTFGSSSKALLVFLSVMILKGGIAEVKIHTLNANGVICAEALKIMESLEVIAGIEDGDQLKASLRDLQMSASTQLLQSWKGFQTLSDRSTSSTSTPNSSEHDLSCEPCQEIDSFIEVNSIDALINKLDMPEELKEEFAALPVVVGEKSNTSRKATEVEPSRGERIGDDSPSLPQEETDKVNHSICNNGANVAVTNSQQGIEVNKNSVSPILDSSSSQQTCLCSEYQSLGGHVCLSSLEEEKGLKEKQQVINEESDRYEEGSSGGNREVHLEEQRSCEEQKLEVECTELEVSGKEREPSPVTAKDSVKEEECQADDLGYHDSHINEEQISHKESQPKVREQQPSLVANEDILIREEISCLGKKHISKLEEHCSFDIDKDSGNEHVSWEEHTDTAEEAIYKNKLCGSEEQTSYEEKGFSSEEEHLSIGQTSDAECHESHVEEQLSEEETNDELEAGEGNTNCEINEVNMTFDSTETPKKSVAERVHLLEKKAAGLDQRRIVIVETPGIKRKPPIELPITDEVDNLTNASKLPDENFTSDTTDTRTSRSAPQSSLAFSYDSNSCSTRDRERNRVKSLKEMFVEKNVADIQYGRRRSRSPNKSDLSDSRSNSDGHLAQTLAEVPVVDESLLQSVAKGIVRRTIERLYGKDGKIKDSVSEKPLPAPKPKLRDGALKSILSPFRTKGMSDLSYFNATNSYESYCAPTRCIPTYNAQVSPVDIDTGRWLFKENTVMRKSVSEPTTIHKETETCAKPGKECDCEHHTKEDVPYSHFNNATLPSESQDDVKPVAPKCTYFTLPHGHDSELYQDDLSTPHNSSAESDLPKEKQDKTEEEPEIQTEKKATLPDLTPIDLKELDNKVRPLIDNKVHPLIEGPTEGQAVIVVQPGKGRVQSGKPGMQPGKNETRVKGQTAINSQDPDVLDKLYIFCGQHCPVL